MLIFFIDAKQRIGYTYWNFTKVHFFRYDILHFVAILFSVVPKSDIYTKEYLNN